MVNTDLFCARRTAAGFCLSHGAWIDAQVCGCSGPPAGSPDKTCQKRYVNFAPIKVKKKSSWSFLSAFDIAGTPGVWPYVNFQIRKEKKQKHKQSNWFSGFLLSHWLNSNLSLSTSGGVFSSDAWTLTRTSRIFFTERGKWVSTPLIWDRRKVSLFHVIEKCYFMRFVFTYIHHLCDWNTLRCQPVFTICLHTFFQ